jgi:2-octaprenyl-6-methoxyphenol hydroxylase
METPLQPRAMEHAVDLAVIGGGLVGTSLAIACANAGLKTALVEAEAPSSLADAKYDGRSSAIAHGSKNVLEAIGVWPYLAGDAQPIVDIRVTDGGWHVAGESKGYVHYSCLDLPPSQYYDDRSGPVPFGYIVENRVTRRALLRRVRECANLLHLSPAQADQLSLDQGQACISLKDGSVIHARLIGAADGKQSALRDQAGIGHRVFEYGQTAIVCTVAHDKPHHGVAHEHFLPAGPFAMLPMTDLELDDGSRLHRSSIVWSEDPRIVPLLLGLSEAQFGAEIERRFGSSLGRIRPLGKRFSYPLNMVLADGYTRQRFALLGDAAHGIHPIAGQGFNLGVRDAAALAEVVVDADRSGQDIGDEAVLERFARWRRFDNLMLAGVMDGLTRLFSNDVGPLRLARDVGFFLFNRTMPLKRLAMRHAMGVVGTLPRLVQGRPL